MRFAYPELNLDFEFDENFPTVVVIEDKKLFSQTVFDAWNQLNGYQGNLMLSDNNKLLKFDKQCDVIMNPFAIDFNSKKILSKIYDDLESFGKDTCLEQIIQLNGELVTLLDELSQDANYPITFDLELDLKGLMKLYHVRVDEYDEDVLSLLISYVKLLRRVMSIKTILFVNLKTFFSRNQITELYTACRYEEVAVVDLESFDFGKAFVDEHYIIVDKDLCYIEV